MLIMQMFPKERRKEMNEYKEISKEELQDFLEKYPKKEKFRVIETKLGVTIVPISEKTLNKNDVLRIANSSKTIIYSDNKFIEQVDMHSVKQDIYNVKRQGILNTILVKKERK